MIFPATKQVGDNVQSVLSPHHRSIVNLVTWNSAKPSCECSEQKQTKRVKNSKSNILESSINIKFLFSLFYVNTFKCALQQNMKQIKHNNLRIPPDDYLQSVVELSSGLPKTNPASSREEDLNPGPPDYKSSALTTRPRRLLAASLISPRCLPGR